MKITLELYRSIQEYIKDNFEKTSGLDYPESEILALLEKPYEPEDLHISSYLRKDLTLSPPRFMVDFSSVGSALEFEKREDDDPRDTYEESSVRYALSDVAGKANGYLMEEDAECNISSFNKDRQVRASKIKNLIDVKEPLDRTEEIKRVLELRDEGFREMLFRKIDEMGMTDAECYKKAQLTRSHFNKIKNDDGYNPKKPTVVALGLALELPDEEFIDFVSKAGYSLTKSNAFDLIIRYAVCNALYDLDEVNDMLYDFDQQILGAGIRE